MNPRRKIQFFITNQFTRGKVPHWGLPLRLTPAQARREIAEFKRLSGGCDIGWRAYDNGVDCTRDLIDHWADSDARAAIRKAEGE